LQQQLKHVDLVIEVLDARAPLSSRHPRAVELFGAKPRLIILSKKDLADGQRLKQFLQLFQDPHQQVQAIALSLKSQENKTSIFTAALELTENKRQQLSDRGLLPRPIRVCVVGMPNVGKSSFINWLIGQKKAKVGNKPGITRGPQWVRVHPQIELLDTPGVLPNATFAEATAQKLALFNLLPESSYDMEEIA
jgi:ribosome biogenesis GTPase A